MSTIFSQFSLLTTNTVLSVCATPMCGRKKNTLAFAMARISDTFTATVYAIIPPGIKPEQ